MKLKDLRENSLAFLHNELVFVEYSKLLDVLYLDVRRIVVMSWRSPDESTVATALKIVDLIGETSDQYIVERKWDLTCNWIPTDTFDVVETDQNFGKSITRIRVSQADYLAFMASN